MSPTQPREGLFDVRNEASDHATIGVQGVVYGDVRYEVRNEDPPERKLRVAKNCLAGGMPRRAEELIKELFEIGFANPPSALANEIAYHWLVAVLGDRSFELLGDEEFGDIERAQTLVTNGPADDWHQACDVLLELVECLRRQAETGQDDTERLDAFFAAFDGLPDARREEIWRHLDLILSGAMQDRLESRLAEIVRRTRTGDGRVDRVWKFFEPDPAEPRPIPVREPSAEMFQRTAAIGGALLAGAAFILSLVLIALLSAQAALSVGVLLILGGGLVAVSVPSRFPKRYSAFAPQNPGLKDPEFASQIRAAVRLRFNRRAPEGAWERSRWTIGTRQFESRLTEEIIDLYSEARIEPDAIDWLIDWHARESVRRWRAGEFQDTQTGLGFVSGVAILIGTGLYMLYQFFVGASVSELSPTSLMNMGPEIAVAVVWFLVGFLLLALSDADLLLWSRITYSRNKSEAETRTREERQAYERRRTLLGDRPDDADMVRWLDYDKIYLKRLAMNQHGLGNRDITAHATLTGPAPGARRARFRSGPPRFSAYHVWIFLLTPEGVRQITVRLDFPTGIAQDQQRTEFRYDVIAAAHVTEIGLVFDDGQRKIIFPHKNQEAERRHDTASSAFILSQKFRLSLISGEEISITVENLDEWMLQGDQNHVPENSELTGALRILEAVAADGRDWIERARKRHGIRTYPHYSPNGDRL